ELVRFGATLSFIMTEEEFLVLLERASDRRAVLVLPQHGIGPGQDRLGVERVVHPEKIGRTVVAVPAGFGHDVYKPAQGSAIFSEEGGVQHTKFLYRFLRRGDGWQSGKGLDVVHTVHQDQRAKFRLATKGQTRRRRRSHAGVRLFEGAAARVLAAWRHSAGEFGEIYEVAPDDRERFDRLFVDDAAHFRLGRFDQRLFLLDLDHLAHVSDLQGQVQERRAADGQGHVALRPTEPGALGPNLVLSGSQIGEVVATFAVSGGFARRSRVDIRDADPSLGNDCAGGVSDHAGESCSRGLSRSDWTC